MASVGRRQAGARRLMGATTVLTGVHACSQASSYRIPGNYLNVSRTGLTHSSPQRRAGAYQRYSEHRRREIGSLSEFADLLSGFRPESLRAAPAAGRRSRNTAAARVMRNAGGASRRRLLTPRATEFISVGSFGPDRSALCSDMRFARISGLAAATVPLSAPMNSSTATQIPRRAGFLFNSSL